jgi:hypothetical protein
MDICAIYYTWGFRVKRKSGRMEERKERRFGGREGGREKMFKHKSEMV